jgi:hypothetical protein
LYLTALAFFHAAFCSRFFVDVSRLFFDRDERVDPFDPPARFRRFGDRAGLPPEVDGSGE